MTKPQGRPVALLEEADRDSVFSRVTPVAAAPAWNVHVAPTRPYRLDDLVAAAQALGLPEDAAVTLPVRLPQPAASRPPLQQTNHEQLESEPPRSESGLRTRSTVRPLSRRRTFSRALFATVLCAILALLAYEGWIVVRSTGGVQALLAQVRALR